MKNTVKIASIQFNDEFTNANDIKQHTLNILLTEPIIRGSLVKKNPDDGDDDTREKILKKSDRYTIDFKEFLKLISLDDNLGQLDPKFVNKTDEMSWKEEMEQKYGRHLRILTSSTIVIEREEIKEFQYKRDDSGELILDSEGNPVQELDKDGNPIKVLVGFGESHITDIKLSDGGKNRLINLLNKQDE